MTVRATYLPPYESVSDLFRRVFFETTGAVNVSRRDVGYFDVRTADGSRTGTARFIPGTLEVVFEGIEPTDRERGELPA